MGRNEINDAYHHEVAEFLRQLTGAREVIGQNSGLIVRTSFQAKKRTWAPPAIRRLTNLACSLTTAS